MFDLGARPFSNIPIRKKAWHRALKRGALWAIVPYEHMKKGGSCLTVGPNRFARILPDPYCPANQAYVIWPMEGYEY